jgi:hypothetical protein
VINKKKVRRLMRKYRMIGRRHRRKLVTAFPGSDGYVIPDLLGRRFDPGAADVAWCQDVTLVPTGEGWLFLASVLDLGSRRLLGYSMVEHLRTSCSWSPMPSRWLYPPGAAKWRWVIARADRGNTPPTTNSTTASRSSCGFRSEERVNARQRRGRELLGIPQTGVAARPGLRHPGRSPPGSSCGSTGTTRPGFTPASTGVTAIEWEEQYRQTS